MEQGVEVAGESSWQRVDGDWMLCASPAGGVLPASASPSHGTRQEAEGAAARAWQEDWRMENGHQNRDAQAEDEKEATRLQQALLMAQAAMVKEQQEADRLQQAARQAEMARQNLLLLASIRCSCCSSQAAPTDGRTPTSLWKVSFTSNLLVPLLGCTDSGEKSAEGALHQQSQMGGGGGGTPYTTRNGGEGVTLPCTLRGRDRGKEQRRGSVEECGGWPVASAAASKVAILATSHIHALQSTSSLGASRAMCGDQK